MSGLNEIRSTFLEYFRKNGHEVLPSSPLVPRNDPTLMFTNSGMVQFKNVFTGLERRDPPRAVTSQKCVRAGGKHNDLDNVGYTARHHTFFEMLGNFSFGDYFKERAVPLCWDLVTREFGISKDRLLVTIYHDDEEAAEIWRKHAGLSSDQIIRISTSDNFWSMGPVGPCGPCSEIFYDHGEAIPGGPPGSPDEDGDRFIEIWNLVFMQFEQCEGGDRQPLPKPSIDTGMGLERIGALLQGKHDNYDTDLMRALIEASANAISSDPDGPDRIHHRVIADHIRSGAFLIAEGVMPSNEGRGNVLRRIMRRAMRHASQAGASDPVMHKLVAPLVAQMGSAFPELASARAAIEETFLLEETGFRKTLDRGLDLLGRETAKLQSGGVLPGEVAFKLYDTYGFPLDLTQDALRETGHSVDVDGFDKAMAEQKAKARSAWAGSGERADSAIWFSVSEEAGPSEFLGYGAEASQARILALVKDGKKMDKASKGDEVEAVFNQTPFYAQAGGQVCDTGELAAEGAAARVVSVYKAADVTAHLIQVTEGELAPGLGVALKVDHGRRMRVRGSHSATHLLHEALRQGLGEHVAQRGSLNDESRLRFDFSHSKAMGEEEIQRVEDEVNRLIRQNAPVQTRIMSPDDARELGAQALFGEKYGDEVRVVSMGIQGGSGKGLGGDAYSVELCGGTHVDRTGEIGAFAILSEAASSAGVRRIEALTGEEASRHHSEQARRVSQIASILKSPPEDIVNRAQALVDERKSLLGEVKALKAKLAMSGDSGGDEPEAPIINGVPFLARHLHGMSGKELPALVDEHKKRLGSGVILLTSDNDGKVAIVVGVTEDLAPRISAVDAARSAAVAMGGKGGGGRPDLAQAGGADPSKANDAAEAVRKHLEDL